MPVAACDFFSHMDDFLEYRKVVYEVSPETIKSNTSDLNLFYQFMEEKKYSEVNGQTVMAFQYYLKNERKNCGASMNRKLFTLRAYSQYLQLQDNIEGKLPFCDALKSRQGYKNRPNALTKKQVKGLFDLIDRTTLLGIRDYAVYALMYRIGLRVGEVFSLTLDCLDFDNNKINIMGKGKKKRVLHLPKEMIEVLSEWIGIRSNFYNSEKTKALFISKKGNPIAIRTMEDNFQKLIARSSLSLDFPVTCHTLRHTFASHLNDEEVDILVIQSLMGHSSPRSTQGYIHPSAKRIKEAMEKLPGVIFMKELLKSKGVLKFQLSRK